MQHKVPSKSYQLLTLLPANLYYCAIIPYSALSSLWHQHLENKYVGGVEQIKRERLGPSAQLRPTSQAQMLHVPSSLDKVGEMKSGNITTFQAGSEASLLLI